MTRDSFVLCWDQKVTSITRCESTFDMRWFGKMRLLRGPSILLALVVSAIEAVASEPIYVEYGKGHSAAFALLKTAEKQAGNGDLDGAVANLTRAMRGDPKFWPALYTRAQVYQMQHSYQLAIQDCNELLRQYPYLVEAALLRASVNAKLGNYAQSLKEVDHIVSIRPRTDGLARALSQRAWLRLTARDSALRDAPQALKDAKQACNLMLWKDADMIDTLAVAYAANGDFDSAVKYEEKALRTKEITPEETKTCQEHLASFKQNRPFWQSP
jgi:tetratricopeptide (TPR) repeat protein